VIGGARPAGTNRDLFVEVVAREGGGNKAVLSGRWVLVTIGGQARELASRLSALSAAPGTAWDSTAVEALDSAGAMLLWRAWGRQLPPLLEARPEHLHVFERIASADRQEKPVPEGRLPFQSVADVGEIGIGFGRQFVDFVVMTGEMALDFVHLLRHPGDFPSREISANLYKSGVRAMPVTALVGFLIGVVLSYLSSLQLRQLGADVFIVDLLGMGIIRELGPVLVAVLVAGRSGSAMTAQLGVMRVTEEMDALETMGVSRSLRLLFPKVAALAMAMPLLVLWATAAALIGGMVAAQIELDVSYGFFIRELPKAVPAANLGIGLIKGLVFGIFVALVACHFGLRVLPNTESLSANTTASVVTSITVVILIDALFAIITRNIGIP
jgi:phospholipid/cholesterol/gamma-HCH transport system permease protein